METGGEEPPGFEQLSAQAQSQISALLDLLERDPEAPTTVADRQTAMKVHVADSLAGLAFAPLVSARTICDLGAGAGFPGLALAAALPDSEVDLIESVGRKCEFMARAIQASSLRNARVLNLRSEDLAKDEGRESYDVVTARAVGRLSTLAELASPLLKPNGLLIAWKGKRDPDEEAELARAAEFLAMTPEQVLDVGAEAGSKHRHLHPIRKTGPTPASLPRKPGLAKKRPKG
jgi:16S rRNA (guanine527-N7)-methyltransferase